MLAGAIAIIGNLICDARLMRACVIGDAWGRLIAAGAAPPADWPDAADSTALVLYVLVAFGTPALGYAFMALDIRRYLRSLRRALVVVASAASGRLPAWSTSQRPPCMQELELDLPCTEEQVLAAYRRRVKDLHPDRGGNLQQFLRLQKHFEQAMHLARSQSKARAAATSGGTSGGD